jgi:hypothetical protein
LSEQPVLRQRAKDKIHRTGSMSASAWNENGKRLAAYGLFSPDEPSLSRIEYIQCDISEVTIGLKLSGGLPKKEGLCQAAKMR